MKTVKTYVPVRYLPKSLSKKDRKLQAKMLLKSRRLYKSSKSKYYTRKKLASYTNKPSNHISNAIKIYKIDKINPNPILFRKGEGAYYSSGSRPNQSPQSWGYARLASSITGGKAAAVDYNIIDKGCKHNKKAFILANKSRKKYKYGHSSTKTVAI